ncbi:two-component system, OmpR family, sensor histidine kinase CpxA [Trichlorobacter thiogenes]|uniref:histidine kinase n=1 Tax=Trichlorobacter thiogenes TaxID=115783 RepID=A0A1T4QFD0_9BACT|nr:ATP-binding protein [Trichlorobacter thiogenes]SKA02503.1 two-component system, OmpR family, sensor histidine kinase CpxA [Trichlorobacter thiogenes]
MRSLFVKLFFWFWLTVVLSGGIFFLVAIKTRPGFHPRPPVSFHQGPQAGDPTQPGMQQPAPLPPPAGHHPEPPPHGFPSFPLIAQLVIYFVVGGLACYLLAWRLTAPIRRLRRATQQLAQGDLTARVGFRAAAKGDEIADLGRDFDRMAEQLEVLMSAQKQLVRDISHELRSPLARLNVALGLARREAPASAAVAFDRIEQESDRLNQMISELLTLTLLESGSKALEKRQVDLAALTAEVVDDADFEAAGSGRTVQLVATPVRPLTGNYELLRRALENVVRNAVRYTAPGTVVEVHLEQETADEVCLRVRDHGPGVPEEALSAIFKPFFRVAEARDRQSGGTGIGLAITAGTIKHHGGTVTARNLPEGGLEVLIRLPLSVC